MSKKKIPTPVEFVVCDLCGEKIEYDQGGERVNLTYNQSPLPVKSVKPKRFIFSHRTDGKPNWRWIDWDFHPECLIKALDPLIKDEDDAEAD